MKNFTIEIKWAFIFIAISLTWMIIERAIGLHDVYIDKHAIYTNLFSIPAIIVYVLALKDKKKNFFKGKMNWTQGFVTGIIISFIITILSPLAQYITSEFITPYYFKHAIDYAVKSKSMTFETASEYFNLKSYIIQASFGGLSMGVFTSAIVPLFFDPTMFNNPFSFNGRIRRSEYIISLTLNSALFLYLIYIIYYEVFNNFNLLITILFILIFILPIIWFLLAQGAKRCHDFDKSGWFQLIPFFIFWMIFQKGNPETNEYGKDPRLKL